MDVNKIEVGKLYWLNKAWTDEWDLVICEQKDIYPDLVAVWVRFIQGVDKPKFLCYANPERMVPFHEGTVIHGCRRGPSYLRRSR